jgi:hypothetical protein
MAALSELIIPYVPSGTYNFVKWIKTAGRKLRARSGIQKENYLHVREE